MISAEDIRNYCIQKKHVTEHFPFDEHTLVFKVANKMFLLVPLDEEELIFNAKNTPERCLELREQYASIQAGYHMSKIHWNTVRITDELPISLVFELIDESYELVVTKLPKKVKANW